MTGVGEASLALGLISSVITIFEAAHEIYEAANDTQGLPKKFRVAAEQIPLVYHALSLAEQNIRAQKVNEQALRSAKPVLEACKDSATRVKDIFDKTIPAPNASRADRLKKAVGLRLKSNKVKEDMERVVKNMALLAQHQVFQDAAALEDIKAAVEQLGSLPDQEDQPQFMHSGAGAINANTGSGQQYNYSTSGSGHQYNAAQQYFGRDQGTD